jgi:hypothetical protein
MDIEYFNEEINHISNYFSNISYDKNLHEIELLFTNNLDIFKFNNLIEFYDKNFKKNKQISRAIDIEIKETLDCNKFSNLRFTLDANKNNENNSAKLFSKTGYIKDYIINYKKKINSEYLKNIDLKINYKNEINLEHFDKIDENLITSEIKEAHYKYEDFLLKNIDDHKNLYKTFRLKERQSYKLSDYGIQVDITKIMSSKKQNNYNSMVFVKEISNSGIKEGLPIYEYEIEITDLDKFKKNISTILNNCYINSLKFIYNIPFYCKLNEQNEILNLFHDAFPFNLKQDPNVKSFEKKHLKTIKDYDYSVTNKADGLGLFLYKVGYYESKYSNNTYLIDYINKHVIKYYNCGKSINKDSIFSGEFIINDMLDNNINKYVFGIIDTYLYDGIDITEKELIKSSMKLDEYIQSDKWNTDNEDSRLYYANKFIDSRDDNYESISESKKTIFIKKYLVPDNKNSIFDISNTILNYSKNTKYENDGIIYTHFKKKIIDTKSYGDYPILKWKPPELNSIDFVIKFSKIKKYYNSSRYILVNEDITYNNILYRKVYFYNGSKGNNLIRFNRHRNDHILIPVQNNKIYDKYGNEIMDDTVIEAVYDKHNSEDSNCNWVILRTRHDKTAKYISSNKTQKAGNNVTIAYLIWKTILYPVTEDVIRGNTYWVTSDRHSKSNNLSGMRFFHNLVKQNLIENTIEKINNSEINILDLGCGKFGILNRLININTHHKNIIKTVYGIDLYEDSINNLKDGAKKRYTQMQKKSTHIPENVEFFVANLSKKLPNLIQNSLNNVKFNIIISMFTLHYFLKDNNSLNNFLEIVSNNTAPGGYFIGICFNGKKVKQLLKKKMKNETLESKNNNWSITKQFDIFQDLGSQIEVSTDTGIYNQIEWLVNFDFIEKKMNKLNMHLVDLKDVDENLLELMKKKYKSNFDIENENKDYSFLNSTFIFRKSKILIKKNLRKSEINKFNRLYDLAKKYIDLSDDKEWDEKIAFKTINKSLEYLDQSKFIEIPEFNDKIQNLKKKYEKIKK